MALKLFDFVEKFIMDIFLLILTQFEKTGSIGETFISLGNLIINLIILTSREKRAPKKRNFFGRSFPKSAE